MMNQTIQHNLSMRDQYIIAQALVLGIQELEKVPGVMKEVSNILDMKYLLENQFRDFAVVAQLTTGEANKINTEREVN
jgi:hypothetical protein